MRFIHSPLIRISDSKTFSSYMIQVCLSVITGDSNLVILGIHFKVKAVWSSGMTSPPRLVDLTQNDITIAVKRHIDHFLTVTRALPLYP